MQTNSGYVANRLQIFLGRKWRYVQLRRSLILNVLIP